MSDGDSGPQPDHDEGPEPPNDDPQAPPDEESGDQPAGGPVESPDRQPDGNPADGTEDRPDDDPGAGGYEPDELVDHDTFGSPSDPPETPETEATGTPEHNQVTVSGDDPDPVEAAGPPGGTPTPTPAGDEPTETPETPGAPADPPGGEPGDSPTSTPGAPDDEEMPLTEHIREMVNRLGIVLLVMAVIGAGAFLFADRLINFLWYSLLPGTAAQCPPPAGTDVGSIDAACPRVYNPLALMLARLKVATLVGFVISLPVFVFQTYLFMRPGLYPRERKYYLAAVPTSLVLAGVGVAFAFLLVLPAIFTYFLYYSEGAATIAFGLSETFNLMVMMLGMFAFIFQIPLFVMLAIMMGVTTRRWLESRRIYFWGGFLTIAFFFSPDPTGMAPIIVGATMIILFEGTLALLRWTGAGSMTPGTRQIAGLRPLVWTLVAAVGYYLSPAPMPTGYFGQFPQAVVDGLAFFGLTGATPVIVGGGLIGLFEGVNYLLRRVRAPWQLRRALARIRVPVWLAAVFVGYLASPDPQLLQEIDRTLLTTTQSLVAVGVMLALYEGSLLVARLRKRRSR